MTATEAQVAAAMESLRVHEAWPPHFLTCDCGLGFKVYSEMRTHLAQVVADAVVAAGPDPAKVAADTLREAAQGYYAARHEIGSPSYLQAEDWLLRRADRIEPKP